MAADAAGARGCGVAPLKTRGEVEADVRKGMIRYQREYLGRGPGDVHAHLIDDFIVVRLQDALTLAERQLLRLLPGEKGRSLVKQTRSELVETIAAPQTGSSRDARFRHAGTASRRRGDRCRTHWCSGPCYAAENERQPGLSVPLFMGT